MFCSKCGFDISDDARFCSKCGESVDNKFIDDIRTIKLRCQDCNGVLNVDEDKDIVSCPYCGSERVLLESDDVKIERIKSHQQLETLRIQREIEAEKRELDKKHLLIGGIMWVLAMIGFIFLGFINR